MINYLKQQFGLLKLKKAFWEEFNFLKKSDKTKGERLSLEKENIMPCYWDKTINTDFDHHYVLHTAWASRKVLQIAPKKHIDIASSLYFCTSVSSFVPVEFYDYRPAKIELTNLTTGKGDLTNLHFDSNSIESLSCMHTVEHIGLGRYGEPLDYDGDLKAIAELKRVVKKGGHLLFVVPVGKPKIVFNAHRIYAYEQILKYFEGFDIVEFSLITDDEKSGQLIVNASPDLAAEQEYGCGCFLLKKI